MTYGARSVEALHADLVRFNRQFAVEVERCRLEPGGAEPCEHCYGTTKKEGV